MRIHRLPTLVANQISAGEVIERPASVVKELLENALDAAATEIIVEIGFGGLNQIKVTDNGVGIDANDLPLAVAPHATSKIKQLDDLYKIQSMGFRGEALASIASVSRLEIQSRPAYQMNAMQLSIKEDRIQLLPCSHQQGTTIDVRDLFFNAPVRKKFLKSATTEYQAIEAVVKRFALAMPTISIILKHNGKIHLSLRVVEAAFRVKKIFGQSFIERSVSLDVERAGFHLRGYVSEPSYQRSQNDRQWIYVNGRMVRDKLLAHAIKQAYDGLLNVGRFSACLLYLTVSPHQVDVNVHPTKHELRFLEPRLVHDFLVSQIKMALSISPSPVSEPVNYLPRSLESVQNPCSDWLELHGQFALAVIDRQPYLVSFRRWHEENKWPEQSSSLPWPRRFLNVPISITVKSTQMMLIEKVKARLADFGIEISIMSLICLVVRTVPEYLPSLDFQRLFQSSSLANPDIKFLKSCCDFSLANFSPEDKLACIADARYRVPLSLEDCRALFGE